jgi:hypothetical protein
LFEHHYHIGQSNQISKKQELKMSSNGDGTGEKPQDSVIASWPRLDDRIKTQEAIKKIAESDPVGASLAQLNEKYYDSVLGQAQQSFDWALRAAIAGLVFFLAAVGFLLLRQPENISYVSVICGALVEAISALNFYLYGRAASQLKVFHSPLDRTQRFILARDMCNELGKNKDEIRAKLIFTIANVPAILDSEEGKKEELKELATNQAQQKEVSKGAKNQTRH